MDFFLLVAFCISIIGLLAGIDGNYYLASHMAVIAFLSMVIDGILYVWEENKRGKYKK